MEFKIEGYVNDGYAYLVIKEDTDRMVVLKTLIGNQDAEDISVYEGQEANLLYELIAIGEFECIYEGAASEEENRAIWNILGGELYD